MAHYLGVTSPRPRMTFEEFRRLPEEADGAAHSRAIPGLWVRPEWLLAEPRPRLLEVLRAWGLI